MGYKGGGETESCISELSYRMDNVAINGEKEDFGGPSVLFQSGILFFGRQLLPLC